jgi:hypothetical protein
MRKILITILTLTTINAFGQQWADYSVDSTLTLLIPNNYQIVDTLGQRVITAQIDNGVILVSVLSNKGQTAFNVQNEKELIDAYNEFQKGMIDSHKGQLIKKEIVEKSGLKLTRFSYSVTIGSERQIRHCMAIFVNEKTYAINFWELESMTNEMKTEREKLFSSLKLPTGLELQNQMSYSIEGSRAYHLGHLFGQVFIYVLMLGLFISFIIWVSKKVSRKSTNA